MASQSKKSYSGKFTFYGVLNYECMSVELARFNSTLIIQHSKLPKGEAVMGLDIYGTPIEGLDDRLQRVERPPVVTLTTDFGQYDGYVGTMKGVMLTLLPDAAIVDISHEVNPQQIHEGAFILYRAYRYFPASTIHVAVVDPGVGSVRRPIVLVTGHGTFVGPDNGIFTYILRAEQGPIEEHEMAVGPAWA